MATCRGRPFVTERVRALVLPASPQMAASASLPREKWPALVVRFGKRGSLSRR
jgi:hypothetical protein